MSQGCHIWILGFYRKVSIIFFSIVFCLQLIGLTATVLFRRRRCRSDSVSSLSLSLRSLFALLSKKHNKVLEQATQSLRGRQGDNAALPDYVSKTHTQTH